jgi:hypothetical protein
VRWVDGSHRIAAGRGRRDELGPAVRRVVGVGREAPLDQQVRDPLHALPRQPHGPSDLRDALRLAQHGAEHLPPGGGQADRAGHVLGHRQELPVEPEAGERGVGEQRLLRGLRHEAAISS